MSSETEAGPRNDAVAAKLQETLEADGCLADVIGLDAQDLEVLYNMAYTEHQQGKHADAAATFIYLCQCDHRQARFWMGLGASHQMAGNYEGALIAYTEAADCDPPAPKAPLHAAECLLSLGLLDDSLAALDYAVEMADYVDDRAATLEQIGVLYDAVEQIADQMLAEAERQEDSDESESSAAGAELAGPARN